MNRKTSKWEHRITEQTGDDEITHIIKGRVISQIDIPAILRAAGIPAGKSAFAEVMRAHSDVLVEVCLERCVESHDIGYSPTCNFAPTDFEQEELDRLMLLILKPFKRDLVKGAYEANQDKPGILKYSDVMSEAELKFALDENWFTPEEAAAITAEVFPGEGDGQEHSDDGQDAAQSTP